MRKKKKKKLFGKKFEIIYVEWAVFTCLMMLCFVPILGNTLGNETTYCEVLLDGEVIGAVADPTIVDQAFLDARARIGREVDGLVLANVDCVPPFWDNAERRRTGNRYLRSPSGED